MVFAAAGEGTMAEWFVLAVVWAATAYLLCTAPRIVWTALRTGRIIRRGGFYSVREHPRLYWFGVWFWVLISAMMLIASYTLFSVKILR